MRKALALTFVLLLLLVGCSPVEVSPTPSLISDLQYWRGMLSEGDYIHAKDLLTEEVDAWQVDFLKKLASNDQDLINTLIDMGYSREEVALYQMPLQNNQCTTQEGYFILDSTPVLKSSAVYGEEDEFLRIECISGTDGILYCNVWMKDELSLMHTFSYEQTGEVEEAEEDLYE